MRWSATGGWRPQALGFSLSDSPDYGLRVPAAAKSSYAVLLTMTSRADKLWPDERWVELARGLRMPTMLPWGSDAERERAAAHRRKGRRHGDSAAPERR